jgi:organic radical activating enzyme
MLSSAASISNLVADYPNELVVITGGEPFRQNLHPLIMYLHKRYKKVQIETNGTYWPEWAERLWDNDKRVSIVCSPKTPKIEIPDAYIAAYKYILRAGEVDPNDGLPTKTLGNDCGVARFCGWYPRSCVYVQPYDEPHFAYASDMSPFYEVRNETHIKACVDSCMRFGYRLSLQMHKIIGVD